MTDENRSKAYDEGGIYRSGRLPFEADQRFGLALSGGGYRATLFHLGALRRLNELGMLSRLDRVTCVSGGALLIGHLLARAPAAFDRRGGVSPKNWQTEVSGAVHRFVKNDLRTLQTLMNFAAYSLFFRNRRLHHNIARLEKLFGAATLGDRSPGAASGDLPEIAFLATDAVFGRAFRMTNREGRSGHALIGATNVPLTWTLAKAAAISACFPPLLGPYFPSLSPDDFTGGKLSPDEQEKIADIALIDGGLYDNLGSDLILRGPAGMARLFSDAGNPLGFGTGFLRSPLVSLRYLQLMSSFIGRLRISQVHQIEKNPYAEWSAQYSSHLQAAAEIGFPKSCINGGLENIRTDLDRFSDAECKLLENHGYAQTELGLREICPPETLNPPARWPYPDPDFTDPVKVGPLIENAKKRQTLRQLFRLGLTDPAPGAN